MVDRHIHSSCNTCDRNDCGSEDTRSMEVSSKADINRQVIENIKKNLHLGTIDYDFAKVMAQPIIDEMNEDITKIAKKHGKPAYKLTFIGLMR